LAYEYFYVASVGAAIGLLLRLPRNEVLQVALFYCLNSIHHLFFNIVDKTQAVLQFKSRKFPLFLP
jgi:hypothetical protein